VLGLYKFQADFRDGELSGIFITTDAAAKEIIGKWVSFGEVLGKHSQVSCTILKENIQLLTEDRYIIDVLKKYHVRGSIVGYNPIMYHMVSLDSEEYSRWLELIYDNS